MCKKHISGVQKTTETFLQQKRVATVSATGESAAISEVTSKTFSKAKKRRKEAVAERQEEKSDTEPEPEFRNVSPEESESPDDSGELEIDEEALFDWSIDIPLEFLLSIHHLHSELGIEPNHFRYYMTQVYLGSAQVRAYFF